MRNMGDMDHLDYRKIGQELKRLRTDHSYTQEQFAEDLGCTISFVSNVENNRAKLNLRTLMYYARLCNVSIDSILNAGKEFPEDPTDLRDREFLKLLHEFTPQEQDKLLKLLKFIKYTL